MGPKACHHSLLLAKSSGMSFGGFDVMIHIWDWMAKLLANLTSILLKIQVFLDIGISLILNNA